MKATLAVINEMERDGVISHYAIGGAVGATFYLEPFSTLDVDVFITAQPVAGSALISISPVYQYLTARGYQPEREYIIVEGWPVQFLPPGDALEEEALRDAIETEVDGIRVRVMRSEHLVAMAVRLGRQKDKARVEQFIEQRAFDAVLLDSILQRHGLLEKWERLLQSLCSQP